MTQQSTMQPRVDIWYDNLGPVLINRYIKSIRTFVKKRGHTVGVAQMLVRDCGVSETQSRKLLIEYRRGNLR